MKILYIFLPIALILCFTFGCQEKAMIAELEAYRAQAKIEEQNKEVVKKLFTGLNNRNLDVYSALCTTDYLWYFPSASPTPFSREEEPDFTEQFLSGFPDLKWTIENLIADDDKVIVRWTAKGANTEEFQGRPATGIEVLSSGINIYRLKNGKIMEGREEADLLGFMQQLGMALVPEEMSKTD